MHCNGLYHGVDEMTLVDERPQENQRPTHCRSCGAWIWWRVNPSGKLQPFDYDIQKHEPTDYPHHASCPQGRSWQRH